MRTLAIVGALLLGLIGLLMSVCGGGILLMGVSSIAPGDGILNLAGLTAPFILLGIAMLWACVAWLRKTLNRS